MHLLRTILLTCACAISAHAQFNCFLYSVPEPPIPAHCGSPDALPDGTIVEVFWDWNDDGPDENDVLVPEGAGFGTANFNAFLTNGEAWFGVPGGFVTDPSFTISTTTPQPSRYWLRICVEGAEEYLRTESFTIPDGYGEIDLTGQFVCISAPCTGCPVPSGVSGLTASTNSCDGISLIWPEYAGGPDADSLQILRSGSVIAVLGRSVVSYLDSAAPEGVVGYSIRARTLCSNGDTLYSPPNEANGMRLWAAKTPSEFVAADGEGDPTVALSWRVPEDIVHTEEFVIFRDGVAIDSVVPYIPNSIQQYSVVGAGCGVHYYSVAGWNSTCGLADSSVGDSGSTDPLAPCLEVTYPRDYDSYCTSEISGSAEEMPITWVSPNTSANVRIEIMRGYPNGTWSVISSSTPDDGSFIWPVSGPSADSCRIRITSIANSYVTDECARSFSLGQCDLRYWTADNSPYEWDRNIKVGVGDSLVIEPGVEIEFAGGFGMTVLGTLSANGTEQDSIVFVTDTIAYPTRWHGVSFDGLTSSGSQMAYCRVQDGRSTSDWGGNVRLDDSASISISHCSFLRGFAPEGGAILIQDGSQAIVEDCHFTNNSSNSGGAGGAISVVDASPVIRNCNFEGNTAQRGGAIHMFSWGLPIDTPTVSQCVFLHNSATLRGGGVEVAGQSMSSVPTLVNCTFWENASPSGGGIYVTGNAPTIENCAILSSTGTGISFTSALSTSVRNCLIDGNSSGHFSGNLPVGLGVISTRNIYDYPCDVLQNLYLPPLLMDAEGGNFMPSADSPCIDGGNELSPIDPDGSRADIGAVFRSHDLTLSLLSPNGENHWFADEVRTIYWSDGGSPDIVRVELKRGEHGSSWESLADVLASNESFTWLVTGPQDSVCRIRLTSLGASGESDESNAPFQITAPEITIVHPDTAFIVGLSSSISIQWLSNVEEPVNVQLNRHYPEGIWEDIIGVTPNDGSEVWTVIGDTTSRARVAGDWYNSHDCWGHVER